MSPSRTQDETTTMVVTPLEHEEGKTCSMGLDLNELSDADLALLKAAIYEFQVVVVKGQQELDPVKHWDVICRLDPEAPQVHGHGTVKQFNQTGGMLAKRVVHGIPCAPNVRLIAKGYQGADHYGIKDFTAAGGASNDWHKYPPSPEAFAKGNTQFQRWHMDAPLYEREPPHFTALRAIKCPVGPDLTINWDDGSGLSMKCQPGQTAFVSNIQLYDLLSEEEKVIAENSWVEYAPYPYMWIENCHGRTNGLGLETEGLEHSLSSMPPHDPSKIKTYPMVWLTPTGRKALQVHSLAVRKLFLKRSPTTAVQEIEDLAEIRKLLHGWQERVIKPQSILLPPVQEGDVLMWDNWSVFHSAVDYPGSYGARTMHQANLGASDAPVGPVPIGIK